MANLWQRLADVVPSDKPASEDRLTMLCDGVFAIAITLLVLDIRLPDDSSHFNDNLLVFFQKIFFYFITFLIIAGYWMTHRRIMHLVQRLDAPFIRLTFLFLSFVALVPATITVVSEFGDHVPAVLIYSLSLVACGLSASALWIYASWKHHLLDPGIDQSLIYFKTIDTLIEPTVFLLSLLLLFIPPIAANPSFIFFAWILAIIPNNILHRVYNKRLARNIPLTTSDATEEEKPVDDEKLVDSEKQKNSLLNRRRKKKVMEAKEIPAS